MTGGKMTASRCKFDNFGYCKFNTDCKFKHATETCDSKCDTKVCDKRHPKPCKYEHKCKRLETCAYRHQNFQTSVDFKAEIEALQNTVNDLLEWKTVIIALKKTVDTLTADNKHCKMKIEHLEDELASMKNKQKQPMAKDVVHQEPIDLKASVAKPLESVPHQKQIDEDVEMQKVVKVVYKGIKRENNKRTSAEIFQKIQEGVSKSDFEMAVGFLLAKEYITEDANSHLTIATKT